MPKEARVKTVKTWEKELGCNLEFDVKAGKATKLRCKDCKRWRDRIQTLKNFSDTWVTGTQSVEKDAVKKHVENCDAHKEAVRLRKRADMGVEEYTEEVLDNTPIGRGMKNMISPDDKSSMAIKFNTAYYLAKKDQEQPEQDGLSTSTS